MNKNCIDPFGRTALMIAIENDNIEMMGVLLRSGVALGDALLHAISEDNVEATQLLLAHDKVAPVSDSDSVRSTLSLLFFRPFVLSFPPPILFSFVPSIFAFVDLFIQPSNHPFIHPVIYTHLPIHPFSLFVSFHLFLFVASNHPSYLLSGACQSAILSFIQQSVIQSVKQSVSQSVSPSASQYFTVMLYFRLNIRFLTFRLMTVPPIRYVNL